MPGRMIAMPPMDVVPVAFDDVRTTHGAATRSGCARRATVRYSASARTPAGVRRSSAPARNGASVSLSVQVEAGDGTHEGEPWRHARSRELLAGEHPGTCCLRFIEPRGEVVFNQAQLPVLLAELRALGGRIGDPALRPVLRELVAFVQAAAGRPRTFVRFVGD